MPIEPGTTLGQYQIGEKLGEGGMGSVYKAMQSGVNRAVVVKVLSASVKENPEMLVRFKRELDIIAQLEHPHILPVYDFGEFEGNPFIVMRFMGGGSLLDVLKGRSLSRDQLLRIFEQIAEALDYAHGRSIIHRDLKPANVLLDDRGNAYLADFGLARTLEGGADLTKTGSILGTPAYMSPEQGRGEKLDQRSDVYALGVMAFEALAGRPPFQAETSWKLITKHLTEAPPLITAIRPDLPQAVEEVIGQSLAKDRNDRPAKAGTFVKALRAALASTEGPGAAATGPAARARPGGGSLAAAGQGSVAASAARSASAAPRTQSTVVLPQSAVVAIPVVLLALGGMAVIAVAAIGLYLFRDRLIAPQVFTYPVGTAPRAMIFDGHDLWVASGVGQFVARISATGCDQTKDSCGQAVATYPADSLVTGIAFDGSNVWLANGIGLSLSKLDPADGQVVATTQLSDVPSNLIFAGDSLWVTSSQAGKLIKVSPDGAVTGSFAVDGGPLAMAFDGRSLWIATETSRQLVQLDPQTGQALKSVAIEGSIEVNALAYDGQSIWIALQDKNELVQVDASGTIVGRAPVGSGPVAIVAGGDSLWVANRGSGTVSRVDPAEKKVSATYSVSPKPYALSYVSCGAGCGDLWIIDVENDVLQRIRVP